MNEELAAIIEDAKTIRASDTSTDHERKLAEAVLILSHYLAQLIEKLAEAVLILSHYLAQLLDENKK